MQLIREIKGTNIITLVNRNKDDKLSQISEHEKHEKL